MFLDKFKAEIMKYPCIHDKSSSSSKNKDQRKTAWEKVAAATIGEAVWRNMSPQQKEAKGKVKRYFIYQLSQIGESIEWDLTLKIDQGG